MHLPTGSAPSVLVTLRRAGVRVFDGESLLAPLPADGKDAAIPRGTIEAIRDAALGVAAKEPGAFLLWAHPMTMHDHREEESRVEVPATPAHVPASYKRAVRHVDTILGELWDALTARGLAGNLTWVLLADHGEAFGEAGLWSHGAGAPDAILRVPCALWGPGLPALAVDQLASQRGLPATLLGLYGLEAEAHTAERFGRSWLRWLAEPRAQLQKLVVVRSARGTSGRVTEGHLLVLLDEHYRFISAPEEGSFELFAAEDQDLVHDLRARLPDVARRFRATAATVSDEDGYPVRLYSAAVLNQIHDM